VAPGRTFGEMTAPFLAAAAIGYVLGSIPFGFVLGRFAGFDDIRRIGSGSIGATNVLRTGKKGLAALTLCLDLAKGAAAVALAERWGAAPALVAAGAAVLGHMFPVWLGFRGGKGGATGLGVLIVLLWPAAVAAALAWLCVALLFRYSSLATLVAAAAAAISAAVRADPATAAVVAGIAAVVVLRHHANIRRLIAGCENRISLKKG
jgi:acyl phosphate:glycerol-3-phosphate acyltransferase